MSSFDPRAPNPEIFNNTALDKNIYMYTQTRVQIYI